MTRHLVFLQYRGQMAGVERGMQACTLGVSILAEELSATHQAGAQAGEQLAEVKEGLA